MFCGECGTKNEGTSKFCENCGAKLENVPEQETETLTVEEPVAMEQNSNVEHNQMNNQSLAVQPAKPMSKKTKTILTISAVIIAILGGVYYYLGTLVAPEKIAENYFNAMVEQDSDKIYEYMEKIEGEFTTKEMFKKVLKNANESDSKMLISNYTVGDVKYDDLTKMTAKVTITYLAKDAKKSSVIDIELKKGKNKKWLLYDNWQVATSAYEIEQDFKIKVDKGATVKIEGKKLDKEYLDKESTTTEVDYYKIPAMFGGKYKINIAYSMGVNTEELVNVLSGYYYPNISSTNITKKSAEKFEKTITKDIQLLYDSVIAGKKFEDIKSNFEYKNANLSDITSSYNSLLSNITSSYKKLTNFKVKEVKISRIYASNNKTLSITVDYKYDYTIEYVSGSETKTSSKNSTDNATLVYEYNDNSYRLTNAKYLETFFAI